MDEQEKIETKNLEVLIDGRIYTLAGSCSEEHLQRIGRYIDKRISEARRIKTIRSYNFDLNTLFIIINTVDDLLAKQDKADEFEKETRILKAQNEGLQKQILEVQLAKHDKAEELENEIKSLKKQLLECQALLEKEKKELINSKNELARNNLRNEAKKNEAKNNAPRGAETKDDAKGDNIK